MKCRAVDGRGKCTHEGGKRLENQVDIVELGAISSSAQCPGMSLQISSVSSLVHGPAECRSWRDGGGGQQRSRVEAPKARNCARRKVASNRVSSHLSSSIGGVWLHEPEPLAHRYRMLRL